MNFRLLIARFEVGVTLAVAAFLCLLTMTGAGEYFEQKLYLTSYFRVVDALGRGPKLDPSLRVVLADDASLVHLGRHPTFSEWREIATVLKNKGFERVLYAGYTQLDGELGEFFEVQAPPPFFAVGSVGYVQSQTFIPDGAKTELGDKAVPVPAGEDSGFRPLKFVLGTRPEVSQRVDAFGHLNLSGDYVVPYAYAFGDQVLPYLAMHANPGLRWAEGGLADAAGPLPRPAKNELYIDYPRLSDVLGRAIPSKVFFTKKSRRVVSAVGAQTSEILAGGKVALLIPDAVSGGRHVISPFGGYPAFTIPIAMTSSALSRHLLYAPVTPEPLVAAVGLLALALTVFLPLRGALYANGGLLVLATVLPTTLLFARGLIFPVFGMSGVVLVTTLARLCYFFAATWKQKMLASRDLEMGRTIQSLLLPSVREARVGEWSYKIVFEPHGPMSGDWFQTYHVKDDAQALRFVVAIGDVIGKGPSAALNTATITSVWKRYERVFETSPDDLTPMLHELAHVIEESYRGEQTSSIQLAAVYRDRVRLISCAAPLWLKVDDAGKVQRVKNRASNPLGMRVDGAKFQMVEQEAKAGEVFVAHTDGVMEGSDCFARFSARLKREPVRSFEIVAAAAKEAGKGLVLPDDVTMLMISREREGGEHELPSKEVG